MTEENKPSKENSEQKEGSGKKGIDRRSFMKLSGIVGAATAAVGLTGGAISNAKSFDTYAGFESLEGKEYFNREAFRVDQPTYEIKGELTRMDQNLYAANKRRPDFKKQYLDSGLGEAGLAPNLKQFYAKYPSKLASDKQYYEVLVPAYEKEKGRLNKDLWALSKAFDAGWNGIPIAKPTHPDEFDWKGVREPALKVKDREKLTALIKKMGHMYGATLVGITKLNPAFVYKNSDGGRGYEKGEEIKIPDWWEYAIVLVNPHEPDRLPAVPLFYTPREGYTRVSTAAGRLTSYIKSLGYPARPHSPNHGYEVFVSPLAIDAGLGEQGRFSITMFPEFGGAARPAVITTNLPLIADKPIKMGLKEFCQKCMICADQCPSGAIPKGDPELQPEGFVRWRCDSEKCHDFYATVPQA